MTTPLPAADNVTEEYIEKINKTLQGELPRSDMELKRLAREITNSKDLTKAHINALLGALSTIKGNPKDVHHHFMTALESNPNNPNFYGMYLKSLMLVKDFEMAIQLADRYFDTFSSPVFISEKAQALYKSGRYIEALNVYKHFIELTKQKDHELYKVYKEFSDVFSDEQIKEHSALKGVFYSYLDNKNVFVNREEHHISIESDDNKKAITFIVFSDVEPKQAAQLTTEFMFNADLDDISPDVLLKSHFQIISLEEYHVH